MGARVLVVDDSPTIRKVVASILRTRSFEPVLAEDGRAALDLLDGGTEVDLVLLDFVMPRMNGYQFCRELRTREALKKLPVVLMSAKGDKIRGQFVQQTGSVDAITKPFDARGLIAVVEGAIKRKIEGRLKPIADVDSMAAEEDVLESRPSGVNWSNDPGLRRAQAARDFAQSLAQVLRPAIAELASLPNALADELPRIFQETLTAETLGTLGGLLKTAEFGLTNQQVLAGNLSVISIAEVLQLLELQRQTGALNVFDRNSEIVLFIREGRIDFASGRGLRGEFLLGRYLVEDGVLSREELQHVLDHRAGSKRLIGEMLVQLGHATDEQIKAALVRQTSEIVYELVRWQGGRFAFHIEAHNAIAEKAQLGLSSGALVMEGFRRVDEWRLIEGSFDFDEVLYRDDVAVDRAGDAKLTRQERSVLAAIDGERTVREIVDEMGGSSFELCKILYQFLNSRLVRRKAA